MMRLIRTTFTALVTILLINSSYASNNLHTKLYKHKAITPTKPENETPEITAKPTEQASSPLTGIAALTTNYMLRGVTQTANLPAAQAGLTYTFLKTGVYGSIWMSNVNFPDFHGVKATLEVDSSIGITNKIKDAISYNIYYVHYGYPKSSASYNELNAILNYYFLTFLYAYSNNEFASHSAGSYFNLGAKFNIPPKYIFKFENIYMSGGIGFYDLSRGGGLRSYQDYNLQIGKQFGSYNVAIAWTDTNFRSIDPKPNKDSHVIGTITYNF